MKKISLILVISIILSSIAFAAEPKGESNIDKNLGQDSLENLEENEEVLEVEGEPYDPDIIQLHKSITSAEEEILGNEEVENEEEYEVLGSGYLASPFEPNDNKAKWDIIKKDGTTILRFHGGQMYIGDAKTWEDDPKFEEVSKIEVGVDPDQPLVLKEKMFQYFMDLSNIKSIEFKNIDSSNVDSMVSMFEGNTGLENLDLGENFDTSNVKYMQSMFYGLESLDNLKLGEKFDTKKVENMESMFNSLGSLEELDLGKNFDTSNVKNMELMFTNMNNLEDLKLGDKFNTSSVENMREMFSNMKNLKSLDVSKFKLEGDVNVNNIFWRTNNILSIKLGDKSFISKVNLGEITPNTIYSGAWIEENGNKSYPSSQALKEKYDGSVMGTYIRAYNIFEVTFSDGDTEEIKSSTPYKRIIDKPADPIRDGYKFIGWVTNPNGDEKFDFHREVSENITLYSKWEKIATGGSSGGSTGGSSGSSSRGERDSKKPVEANKLKDKPKELPSVDVTEKINLNTRGDYSYIDGYKDGTIRGDALISREEVASILYKILEEDYREKYNEGASPYEDVKKDRWSSEAIITLGNIGLIKGYPGNKYLPEKNITRGEVAAIISRFLPDLKISSGESFMDIGGHWAEEDIAKIQTKGWLEGYEGRYRPDDSITRGEFIKLVNRLIDRAPGLDKAYLGERVFKDLDKTKWYYPEIMEAVDPINYK